MPILLVTLYAGVMNGVWGIILFLFLGQLHAGVFRHQVEVPFSYEFEVTTKNKVVADFINSDEFTAELHRSFGFAMDISQGKLLIDHLRIIVQDANKATGTIMQSCSNCLVVNCLEDSSKYDLSDFKATLYHELGHLSFYGLMNKYSRFFPSYWHNFNDNLLEIKQKISLTQDALERASGTEYSSTPFYFNAYRIVTNSSFKRLQRPYSELYADVFAVVFLQDSGRGLIDDDRDFKKLHPSDYLNYVTSRNAYQVFHPLRVFLWQHYLGNPLRDTVHAQNLGKIFGTFLRKLVLVMAGDIDQYYFRYWINHITTLGSGGHDFKDYSWPHDFDGQVQFLRSKLRDSLVDVFEAD